VTTTGEKFNRIPDLVRELQYLASHQVEIGIFADASRDGAVPMLVIAAANEFGAKIPKRQARFEDLDDENPEGWVIIPERSYLRAWFDENVDALQATMERLIGQVVEGKISGRAALETIGGYVVTHVQAYMVDLKTPPNAPSTIARKGSSNPLIDTGQLKDAITWRVVGAK
jgi:hypothetical protein